MSESQSNEQPLISVVTPVYNGERFLRECIRSVISQTYRNWEYVILNNCSTDRSLDIAIEMAQSDSRIKVIEGSEFLPSIDNHNVAISKIAYESQYCKPLMADDWLYPECLENLVAAAIEKPETGLVCCYAIDGVNLMWGGLSMDASLCEPVTHLSGEDICRETLLGGPYLFGTPSSCLIRSDLIRNRRPFYNPKNLHADHESCYDVLSESDFAFVHKILVFNRLHEHSQSTDAWESESIELGDLTVLHRFGRQFLSEDDFSFRRKERLDAYYRVLARRALSGWKKSNWDLHRRRLQEIGEPFSRMALAKALASCGLERLARPVRSVFGAGS